MTQRAKIPRTAPLQISSILICDTRLFPSSCILFCFMAAPHNSLFMAVKFACVCRKKPSPNFDILAFYLCKACAMFYLADRQIKNAQYAFYQKFCCGRRGQEKTAECNKDRHQIFIQGGKGVSRLYTSSLKDSASFIVICPSWTRL